MRMADSGAWNFTRRLPISHPVSRRCHFSLRQSAAILGLGQVAVVPIPVDLQRRMNATATATVIEDLIKRGDHPIAIAATAGTTDSGAIDPLPELAELARHYGLWLHVDAAYAGALILSDQSSD